MAVQYAFVAENGEVQHVMSADDAYVDGQVYDGLTAIAVSVDSDVGALITTQYRLNGAWATRAARENQFQDWVNNVWVINTERFWEHVRVDRNLKLAQTDWTQMPDVTFNLGVKAAWVTYRQALRQVPANNADVRSLEEVSWPTAPGS